MITVPSQIRDFAEWHGGCRHALVWALEISSSEVDELLSAARRRLGSVRGLRWRNCGASVHSSAPIW